MYQLRSFLDEESWQIDPQKEGDHLEDMLITSLRNLSFYFFKNKRICNSNSYNCSYLSKRTCDCGMVLEINEDMIRDKFLPLDNNILGCKN